MRWFRWCVLAMGAGLALVVAGLVVAGHAQWTLLGCGGPDAPCPPVDAPRRLAVELGLLGVIVSSLSTAGVAALLMRQARPPIRKLRPPPPRPVGPEAALAGAPPR